MLIIPKKNRSVVKSGISGRYLTALPGFNCWEGGAVTVLLTCAC